MYDESFVPSRPDATVVTTFIARFEPAGQRRRASRWDVPLMREMVMFVHVPVGSLVNCMGQGEPALKLAPGPGGQSVTAARGVDVPGAVGVTVPAASAAIARNPRTSILVE